MEAPSPAPFDGARYQARIDALAAGGADVHGEAALVRHLGATRVLDAGCGTGRVAIELARHGVAVVGVDRDTSMIAEAARRAPGLRWVQADLAELCLDERFDLVVMAGNVALFADEGTQRAVVARCAAHLDAGGILLAGFQLTERYPLARYDDDCAAVGLHLVDRWATWDRSPWSPAEDYAVSAHRH